MTESPQEPSGASAPPSSASVPPQNSGSYAPPPSGGSSTPPTGGSYAAPPSGGSYGTPPSPGSYGTPATGGYGAPSGGYQPSPTGSGQLSPNDERMWAMLSHLGAIVLGFIAPLVVMLVQGEKSPFVRRQAVESLNFQITLFIAHIVSFVLWFVLIGMLTTVALIIGGLVFMVIAGIAANKGQDYRYPVNLRLVK